MYPLVDVVRQRRLRWLGHVIRMHEGSLVRTVVLKVAQKCLDGRKTENETIFMDVPYHRSVDELLEMANCKKEWSQMCNKICPREHIRQNKKSIKRFD